MPPIALVFTAMISLQVGAAVAKTLFDQVGPAGVVMLRLVFGATAIGLLWRPRIRVRSRHDLLLIGAFAATLACMNLAFYGAIERIPLGIAVTLEFVGPLAVAILGSRRLLDFVWIGLSAAGIVLLAGADDGSSISLESCWRCSQALSGPRTSCSGHASAARIRAQADLRWLCRWPHFW